MHKKSKEKKIRHRDDMHALALIYNNEYARCAREGLPKSVLSNIKKRQQLCVQGVILDIIQIADSKMELKNALKQMRQEKLYPYRWMWWLFTDKAIDFPLKAKVFSLFFPMQWYVVLMNSFFRKRNKKG